MRVPTETDPRNLYEGVPQELREMHQWVCWRLEERDGKTTKVPYVAQQRRRKASSTDPKTWRTFEEAVEASAHHSGIGFVFAESDGLVGVDLDHVRDPETGELTQEASDVIRELDSYTEVSQSGTGVHVIAHGTLTGGGHRQGAIEIYDRARFFVMTGDHVEGTPETVEDRSDKVVALWERMGTRRARGETRATGEDLAPRASTLGLVLDPDAEAPRKIIELLDSNRRFTHTWNGSRSDLRKADGSLDASRYDYHLARFGLEAGWSEQEIANLIIEFRRRKSLDLTKALRDDYVARTIEEAVREQSTSGVLGQLPFDVTRFVQYGTEEPAFDITIRDPRSEEEKVVSFSEPSQLLSKRRAAEVFFAAGYALPKSVLSSWDRITAALLPMKEVEATITKAEIWRGFIAEYLHHARPTFEFDHRETSFSMASRGRSGERFFFAFDHDGTVYMRLEAFVSYVVDRAMDRRATFRTIGSHLRRMGFEKHLLRVGDEQMKMSVWVSPPGFLEDKPGIPLDEVIDLDKWKHQHKGGLST